MLTIEEIQKNVNKANGDGEFTVVSTDADGKKHNFILLKNKKGKRFIIRLNALAEQKYVIKEQKEIKSVKEALSKSKSTQGFNILSSPVTYNDPVYVSCKECGSIHFYQRAHNLHKDPTCSYCRATSGERIVFDYLRENKIVHIVQHPIFIDGNCYWVDCMIVDEKGRPCYGIEFDGRFHYDAIPWEMKKGRSLIDMQRRDATKDAWFEERGIPLIRINYFDFCTNSKLDKEKIEKFLAEKLGKEMPIYEN